jgi:hypothetical protein
MVISGENAQLSKLTCSFIDVKVHFVQYFSLYLVKKACIQGGRLGGGVIPKIRGLGQGGSQV